MAFYALYAAIIIYVLFSSPTPDSLGWAEYCTAALIIASVGLIRGWGAITKPDYPFCLGFHRIFLLYMLAVPLIIGAVYSYSVSNIIRDLIPLLFLVLPLCFYQKPLPRFEMVLMLGGVVFAARYLLPLLPSAGFTEPPLLYLANSPLVPFAAITGFHYFSQPEKTLLTNRLIGLACCAVCLLAMAAMLQRAPFILSVAGCVALLGLRTFHSPVRSMVIGTFICLTVIIFFPFVLEVIQGFTEKTLNVGFNSRLTEWQAVITQSTLLGDGWGAEWQSPAVADIWVRYTHNMVSYYWLKAGVIGGILSVIFIYIWGRQIIKAITCNPALGIAIAVPFFIHVTLYTGFKSLDFALILTLSTLICQNPVNRSPS